MATFTVVIETTENSITITSDRKHGGVFDKLKSFFSWWVKQHFQVESDGYVMRRDTEVSVIYTFQTTKSHWEITNLTKKAIEEFEEDRGINFQLVSEDSVNDTDVLRYNVPKSTENRLKY